MTVTVHDPLAAAREAALRLLARLMVWLWLPVFSIGLVMRWHEPGYRILAIPLVASTPLSAWWLQRPGWPAERRARYAIGMTALISLGSMALNAPRALNTMGVVVVIALAALFYRLRASVALLSAFIVAVIVNLVLTANGWVTPVAPDYQQPILFRVITHVVMFSGLWFSAKVLQQTVQLYRDAQAAAELGVQAMLEAQREAEVLQRRELVSVVATGMAHDLANVVQVMTSAAALLEEMPLHADGRRAIGDLRQVGDEASTRLRTLLSVGRPADAGMEVAFPADLFTRLALVLRPLMGRRITVDLHNDATRPMAIDRGRLEQVLINLALNARDAMPTGGTLRVHAVPHEGGIRFDVSDTGSGIPDEVLARMWEPFYTTKSPGRGTGLGLAMVRRILESVSGRVNVRSTVGQGSTFSVWVPGASV